MVKVNIVGNVVRKPELRNVSKDGKDYKVCTLSVAGNRAKEEALYFDVDVWSGLAEACAKYLDKGSGVAVYGNLDAETYQSSEGEARFMLKVKDAEIEFTDKKPGVKKE